MEEIIDVNTLFGPLPAAASDLSVAELSDLMRRHDVGHCCALSTIGLLLDHHSGNSATRAACGENSALAPVATVNPLAFFAGDSVSRLHSDGFKMLRLFPGVQGWEVDFEPCCAIFRALEGEKMTVMVDLDRPGQATRLVRSVGNYPGSILLAGVDHTMLSEVVAIMRANPHVFLETSNLLATGAIKLAVDQLGDDRLVYGSGAPARPMASVLGVIRHSGLTAESKARILAGNARKLLGL